MERYMIEKYTRREEREGRDGRIRSKTVTTWDVVDKAACETVRECWTRREALVVLREVRSKEAK